MINRLNMILTMLVINQNQGLYYLKNENQSIHCVALRHCQVFFDKMAQYSTCTKKYLAQAIRKDFILFTIAQGGNCKNCITSLRQQSRSAAGTCLTLGCQSIGDYFVRPVVSWNSRNLLQQQPIFFSRKILFFVHLEIEFPFILSNYAADGGLSSLSSEI